MRLITIFILLSFLSCHSKSDQTAVNFPQKSSLSATLLMDVHEMPRISLGKKMRMIVNQSYGRPVIALTIERYDLGYFFCEKVTSREGSTKEYHEKCTMIKPGDSTYIKLDYVYNIDYSELGLNSAKDYGDATALYISSIDEDWLREFSLSYCDNMEKVRSLMEPLESVITLFTLPTCKF